MRAARLLRNAHRRAFGVLGSLFNDPHEAAVINGFWRSGTTWLLEVLATALVRHPVFEPFEGTNAWMIEAASILPLPRRDLPYRNAFMPFATAPFARGDVIGRIVHDALRNRLRPGFDAGLARRGWWPNTKPLVKFTRAALCLSAIAKTYQVPIVHLTRDPRAVISSVFAVPNWGRGAFADLSLRELLLDVDDGRRSHFEEWASKIAHWDTRSPAARVAAYYCLTEWFVERVAQPLLRDSKFSILGYERAVSDPLGVLSPLIASLGGNCDNLNEDLVLRRSVTDRLWAAGAARGPNRPSGWRDRMTADIQYDVEAAMADFGMEHRRAD